MTRIEADMTSCIFHSPLRRFALALAALTLCSGLSGCLMVGGYTSGGGWFLFPGLGTLIVIFLVIFLLRRRR